jgi:Ca-activated chloride channel family protein
MPLLTVQVGGATPTAAGATENGGTADDETGDDDGWARACAAGRPVYLRVERLGEYRTGTALPVEIEYRAEPPVAGPEPAESGSVPGELDPPADRTPSPVSGGSDFGSAPRISPGSTISDTLVAGETRFYAVPLGWGQRLRYRLTPTGVGTPVAADSETARVLLRNPLRAPVAGSSGSSSGSFRMSGDGDGGLRAITGSSATAVRYGNRNADDEKVRGYAFAGTYYLQLSLSPSEDSAELTVPFTLTVDAVDDPAGAGAAPEYLPGVSSGETRTSPAPTGSSGQRSAAAAANPAGAGAPGTPGWVWGLGGGAAALLLAALLALLRRRSG